MKKMITAILTGVLLAAGSLFVQPLAATGYAKTICDCGETTLANTAIASRSGLSPAKPTEDKAFGTYIVQSGDTLSKIAEDFKTDVTTLINLNKVDNPHLLRIGQNLMIPKQEVTQEQLPAMLSIDKILTFNLTAYTAGPESTGKYPGHPAYGITSTGARATEGRTIAVDPRVIPYGTKVYIEGVGIRTAEDTGGAIKGDRIDVYMEDLGQAYSFGVKKNVRVYILSTPNA